MGEITRFLFFSFLIIFLIAFVVLSGQKSEDEIIKTRLLEMGYPEKGYIIVNNTIRYPDGSFVVLSDPPKRYPISAYEAYARAKKYLDDTYNVKLEKHDYRVYVDPGTLTEYQEGDKYYWMFEIRFGKKNSEGDFMGYILVDREKGYCRIRGLFG